MVFAKKSVSNVS